MKIKKICLENFRQFYGNQQIVLSTDENRNVTLIMAENGVGKTTLLNAILWCFYELTTDKFEGKEKIVNREAKKERITVAKVEVHFSHDGVDYHAQRIFREKKTHGIKSSSFHVFQVKNGVSHGMDDSQARIFINSVVPKDMAPYFFFDGEHAETFAAEKNKRNVGKAIRAILGCTLLELATKDLRYDESYFAKVIAQQAGEEEYERVQKLIDEKVDIIEQAKGYIEKCEEELSAANEHLDLISQKLLNAEEARNLEAERRSLTLRLKDLSDARLAIRKRRAEWIASSAVYSLVGNHLDHLEGFLSKQERQGSIPSPYNYEFVKTLLSNKRCVCGAELAPETEAWKQIMALADKAPTAVSQQRLSRVRSVITTAKKLSQQFMPKLRDFSIELDNNSASIRKAEQRKAEVQEQLESINTTEIRDLEARRRQWTAKRDDSKTMHYQLKAKLNTASLELANLKESRERLERANQKLKPYIFRRRLAEVAAEKFEQLTGQYEERARLAIEKRVNEILGETARRDYEVLIGRDFSIDMRFHGQSSPKSAGENQLLSLAFISALIRYAAEREAEESALLIPGTVAPLVLDSPFGQLDNRYRQSTAKFLPQLSDQVVLLLSSSQANDSVMSTLQPYIGRCYALVAHTVEAKGAKKGEDLATPAGPLPALIFGAERDYTDIVSVEV